MSPKSYWFSHSDDEYPSHFRVAKKPTDQAFVRWCYNYLKKRGGSITAKGLLDSFIEENKRNVKSASNAAKAGMLLKLSKAFTRHKHTDGTFWYSFPEEEE